MVEFTFVGIPMIFVLISIFEVSRGMWIYHTLAYSVKNGVRYASVHGINCVNTQDNPNNCSVNLGPADTQGTIAWVIRQAAVGLDPKNTTLTFYTNTTVSATCTLDVSGGTSPCPATVWPPNDGTSDNVGQPIRIDISTPFISAITMFWTGTSKVVHFASGTLGASSQDYVQF